MRDDVEEVLDDPGDENWDDENAEKEFTCIYCGVHRYHLPGQHDQCDHSPTGECSGTKGVEDIDKIKELGSHEKQWRKSLTTAETLSLQEYSKAGYARINTGLRKSLKLPSNIAARVKSIDEALSKSALPVPIDVYRGMVFEPGRLNSLIGKVKGGAVITFKDKGFISTSRSLSQAGSFGKRPGMEFGTQAAIFRIKLKKGQNAAPIEYISSRSLEREVLLPRGNKFKIIKVEKDKMIGRRKFDAIITVEAA